MGAELKDYLIFAQTEVAINLFVGQLHRVYFTQAFIDFYNAKKSPANMQFQDIPICDLLLDDW